MQSIFYYIDITFIFDLLKYNSGCRISGKKDETGVSWTTRREDGTPKQDNSKFFKDTDKYQKNEHIWYDRERGQLGYRGPNMTKEDKENYRQLKRGK